MKPLTSPAKTPWIIDPWFIWTLAKLLMFAAMVGFLAVLCMDMAGIIRVGFQSMAQAVIDEATRAVVTLISLRSASWAVSSWWATRSPMPAPRRRPSLKGLGNHTSMGISDVFPSEAPLGVPQGAWQIARFIFDPEARVQILVSLGTGILGLTCVRGLF